MKKCTLNEQMYENTYADLQLIVGLSDDTNGNETALYFRYYEYTMHKVLHIC